VGLIERSADRGLDAMLTIAPPVPAAVI